MSASIDKSLLSQAFVSANVICAQFATRDQFLQDAHKLCTAVSAQINQVVDLLVLACFKCILPDEIDFHYHETPFDHEYGQAENFIIVFEFREKARKRKRGIKQMMNTIKDRAARFDRALQDYLDVKSFEELLLEAALLVPKPVVFEEELVSASVNSSLANQSENPEAVAGLLSKLSELSVATRTEPAKEAVYGETPKFLKSSLQKFNVDKLFSHQVEGMTYIQERKHVVISTSTASGKSLVFQLPILEILEEEPDSCFMFIYPTKALAQDQSRSLRMALPEDVFAGNFDGDTPYELRDKLCNKARVIFCNPDIIHTTILRNWSDWQRFLSNLRMVVVDELHSYSGVFGGHVAMVFRRLRRICNVLGNTSTQWIACSATVQDPAKFLANLTGLPKDEIALVEKDGSPHGERLYYFLESPFYTANDPSSGRVPPIYVAAPIFVSLIQAGLRVIAFCPYRKVCEQMMRSIREKAQQCGVDVHDQVMSYRGGYNADDRRIIEQRMFSGSLKGIVATSALELGIDIGNLDAVLCVGFPFSLASFRQQIGRAGRRQKTSLAILVGNGSVMDMSFINNPDKVFNDPMPVIPIPLDENLVSDHAVCAAAELSLSDSEKDFFPGDWSKIVKPLELVDGEYHCPAPRLPNPHSMLSLRAIEDEQTAIVDMTTKSPRVIETIERERVPFTCYPGAIYNNQGMPFIVTKLHENQEIAEVTRTTVKWTTRQRDFTDLDPFEKKLSGRFGPVNWAIGRVERTTLVFGYFKFNEKQKIMDSVDLDLPPVTKYFDGMWLDLDTTCLDRLRDKQLNAAAGIHAAQHIMMSLAPKYISCGPGDLGTECKSPEKELLKGASTRIRPARLIFFERHSCVTSPGLLKSLTNYLPELVKLASTVLRSCPCRHGCDGCVALPGCNEKNIVLSKSGARVILQTLIDEGVDDIPDGPEPDLLRARFETVVAVVNTVPKADAKSEPSKIEG